MNLPNKPWNEGETFTNDETGVKYTFDGEKWLAGGGAEADDATLTLINEVDRTAIMRDDALKKEHDEDHTKQSVINAGVVVSLDELFWRDVEIDQLTRDGDKALQEQIDTNKDVSEAGDTQLQAQIDAIKIPEPIKSVISTQLMAEATVTYDLPPGQFTFRQRQGGSTLSPSLAFGIRYFPKSDQDWWESTHEAIAGGYISVVDPVDGAVKWGGVIDSVESDAAGRLLFITSNPFSNGDNLTSRQYLVNLSGCLREK